MYDFSYANFHEDDKMGPENIQTLSRPYKYVEVILKLNINLPYYGSPVAGEAELVG